MTRSLRIAAAVLVGSLVVMSPLVLARSANAADKVHRGGSYVKSVGLRLKEIGGLFTVVYVKPGSPAAAAGVQVDEDIFEVDGQQTLGLGVKKIAKLLKGDAGTTVSVKLGRLLNEARVVQITRQ